MFGRTLALVLVFGGCPSPQHPADPKGDPDTGGDEDGDGRTVDDGDCDDRDEAVYPGAPDGVDDGVDQDCDGADGVDADQDGHPSLDSGGTDCDDADPAIWPGATDPPRDGIDQDCDGVDLSDVDGDGFEAAQVGGPDCEDDDPGQFPGAPEVCNGHVDDCDNPAWGQTDDGRVFATTDGTTTDVTDAFHGEYVVTVPLLLCGGEHQVALDIAAEGAIVGEDGAVLVGGTREVPLVELNAPAVVLRGLTLRDGNAVDGPAVYAPRGGSVTLEDCTVEGNVTTGPFFGAAIKVDYGELTLTGTTFTANESYDTVKGTDTNVTVSDCTFTDNLGGVLYLTNGFHRIEDSTFVDNGWVVLSGLDAALTVERSTFTNTQSNGTHWAIYAPFRSFEETGYVVELIDSTFEGFTSSAVEVTGDSTELTVTGCEFIDNEGSEGAAIQVENATLSITDSLFEGNVATNGGAIQGTAIGEVLLEDTLFVDNAASVEGGAIWLRESGFHALPRVVCRSSGGDHGFRGNSADDGAALYLLNARDNGGLVSEGCDWGEGVQDNVPGPGGSEVALNGQGYAFGDEATFTCNDGDCF